MSNNQAREDLDRSLQQRYSVALPNLDRGHRRRVLALETFLLLRQLQRNITEWTSGKPSDEPVETKANVSVNDDEK